MNKLLDMKDVFEGLGIGFDPELNHDNQVDFIENGLKPTKNTIQINCSDNILISTLLTQDIVKILAIKDVDIFVSPSKFYKEQFEEYGVKYYQYHTFKQTWSENSGAIFLYFLDNDYLFGQADKLVKYTLLAEQFDVPFSFCSLISCIGNHASYFDGNELKSLKRQDDTVKVTFEDMLNQIEMNILTNPESIIRLNHVFSYATSFREFKKHDIFQRLELLNQSMLEEGLITGDMYKQNKQEISHVVNTN